MPLLRQTLVILLIITSNQLRAQVTRSMLDKKLPYIELGFGAVFASIPHYPGSRFNKKHFVPFPAGILRGNIVRAEEQGGVRGRFLTGENWELSLSFGGSMPASTKDNLDRVGMPDLDLMGEVGPNFLYTFFKPTKSFPARLSVSIPIRHIVSTNFKTRLNDRGFIFNPFVSFIKERFLHEKVMFFTSIDTKFTTQKVMDYFYTVAPQFAIPGRSQYKAKRGYLGTSASLGTAVYVGKISVFGGLYYSSLKGAANRNSPLMKSDDNLAIGIGMIYWFFASKKMGSK